MYTVLFDRNDPLPDGMQIPSTDDRPYFGWDTDGRLEKGIHSFERIIDWFFNDIMRQDFNVFGFTMSFWDVIILSLIIAIAVIFIVHFFNDMRG